MILRDFDVTVIDKNGKTMNFVAKNCIVKKSVAVRLGMTKLVEETIECERFDFEIKEKKSKKKK